MGTRVHEPSVLIPSPDSAASGARDDERSTTETTEAPETTTAASQRSAEVLFAAARAEINLRIALQNLILLVVWLVFPAAAIACCVVSTHALAIAVAFDAFVIVGAAIWHHSGVRHAQFRRYLMTEVEPRMAGPVAGWEHFLATDRPLGVLGAHWWISTKGVFFCAPVFVAGACIAGGSATTMAAAGFALLVTAVALLVVTGKPKFAPLPEASSEASAR